MGNDTRKEQIRVEIEQYDPIIFLQALKAQLGNRTSEKELEYIQTIQKETIVPDSVLNAIVIYILMVKKQKNINQKYLKTIAKDWSEKGIVTPKKAIDFVLELKSPKNKVEKRKTVNSRQNKNKPKRVEELPEHIKNPPKVVEMSPERKAEIDRKLKEYLEKSEEE